MWASLFVLKVNILSGISGNLFLRLLMNVTQDVKAYLEDLCLTGF